MDPLTLQGPSSHLRDDLVASPHSPSSATALLPARLARSEDNLAGEGATILMGRRSSEVRRRPSLSREQHRRGSEDSFRRPSDPLSTLRTKDPETKRRVEEKLKIRSQIIALRDKKMRSAGEEIHLRQLLERLRELDKNEPATPDIQASEPRRSSSFARSRSESSSLDRRARSVSITERLSSIARGWRLRSTAPDRPPKASATMPQPLNPPPLEAGRADARARWHRVLSLYRAQREDLGVRLQGIDEQRVHTEEKVQLRTAIYGLRQRKYLSHEEEEKLKTMSARLRELQEEERRTMAP